MVTSPNPPGSPGKDKIPWPLLMLFVLVAVIIAIITILPRARETIKAPVQLSQLEIVPALASGGRSGGIYLDALLHNAGTTAIAEVEVSATFVENNGTLKTITAPVEDAPGTGHSHDLVNDPIKPNESRRVSIYVEEPPTGWNHQPPQIIVEKVSATMPP
jgi:hypothetical protein